MDYIGNLYTKVAEYLWNGSETRPQVKGIKDCGVKSSNYLRWDNELAEKRYERKSSLQASDLPKVELRMTGIKTKVADSAHIQHDINFLILIASGSWKITNATKLYSQIITLVSVLMKSNEIYQWDIGKPYSSVGIVQHNDGQIGQDPEIRKNQPGFTFNVGLAIRINTVLHHPQGE